MPNRPNRVFGRTLPMSLLRAREIVVLQFRPILRRHGINEQQWRVLRVLAEVEEITATRLAQDSAILSPSLSRMLPVLEDRGLIRRRVGASDQRHSVIALEPAGRRLYERVADDFESIYAQIATQFGRERLDRLHAELEELRAALAAPTQQAAAQRDGLID